MKVEKNKHYTNDEFLSSVEELRQHSPIIDGLCRRLQEVMDKVPTSGDQGTSLDCPVCEAELHLTYTDEGESELGIS